MIDNIDFSKVTACVECCTGCKKKINGECEGCIETAGHCKEWKESNGCPVAMCANAHDVQFCGLCTEFPCNLLATKITWNSNVVEQQKILAAKFLQQMSDNAPHADMELWDAYTVEGKLISDLILVRDKPIPMGVCHLVCEALVRHIDGSYLIMQRDNNKRDYPGYFEATAGGSALKGENAEQCIKRELKEETGITAISVKQLGKYIYPESNAIFYNYLCLTDCVKNSVVLQKGETVDYKWLSKDEFIQFVHSDMCIDTQIKRLKSHFEYIINDIEISQ